MATTERRWHRAGHRRDDPNHARPPIRAVGAVLKGRRPGTGRARVRAEKGTPEAQIPVSPIEDHGDDDQRNQAPHEEHESRWDAGTA